MHPKASEKVHLRRVENLGGIDPAHKHARLTSCVLLGRADAEGGRIPGCAGGAGAGGAGGARR
jgi:hypothetical protein